MKTNKSSLVTVALVAALSLDFVNSTFAGPGPQYWAQQHAKAVAAADVKEQPKMPCAKCKDSPVMKPVYGYFPGGEIDDYRIQWTTVGTKHACANCGGPITSIEGKTTNSMQSNCPVCTKAGRGCCEISG